MRRRNEEGAASTSSWRDASGRKDVLRSRPAAREAEKDGELTSERLEELRLRVRARKIRRTVDRIMNAYYLVLAGLAVGFYFCVKRYGIDASIEWYFKGGAALLIAAMVLYVVSEKTDSGEVQALSGMVAITGLPLVAATFFVYVWMNIFFDESWFDAWRALVQL